MNAPDDRYHHGDLATTLRHVAADLMAERGAAGFSLREVARRAGVSHAAPTHHFGDATGLLTAVAVDGFTHLRAAMLAALDDLDDGADPTERLAAIGRAYVEVAVSNPGHCAVVFRHDLVDPESQAYQEAGDGAYDVLRSVVQEVADDVNTDLDVEEAARLCWATMQGLVQLHPNMVGMAEGRDAPPLADIGTVAESFTRLLVEGLRRG